MNLTMQRADVCARQAPDQGKVDVIAVKVDHIEPRQIAKDQFQHANVLRQRLPRVRIMPERDRTDRHETAACPRIATGK